MANSLTKRVWLAIAVLVCAAVAGASVYVYRSSRPVGAEAIPESLRMLPSDANTVAYLDVAALRNLPASPLNALLGAKGLHPTGTDHEYNDFVRDTGFDFRRDLDHMAVAFWPVLNKGAIPPPKAERAFVIADGHFDQEKIVAYALRTGKKTSEGGRTIYIVPGKPDAAFTFLTPGRIALVSDSTVDVERLANPTERDLSPAIQESVSRVAGAPLFAVSNTSNLPESFYSGLQQSPQLQQLVRGLQGLAFAGQPDGKNVQLVLDGQCDSATTAVGIATLLEFFRASASGMLNNQSQANSANKKQMEFLQGLLGQVKVDRGDRWVRLSLELTPEIMGKATELPGANDSKP
jgi:hypothetical protein